MRYHISHPTSYAKAYVKYDVNIVAHMDCPIRRESPWGIHHTMGLSIRCSHPIEPTCPMGCTIGSYRTTHNIVSASVLPGGPGLLPAQARRISLLGSLGWAGAAPKPHTGSSDGDTAVERLSEVVTWLMLAWFGRQTGMKKWECDGLGTADDQGCAKSLRSSHGHCYGGPTSRDGGFSPLKLPMTPHKFAWPAPIM